MRIIDRLLFILGAAFLCAYFVWLAGAGLHTYFSPDDLMNLYWSWHDSWWSLVRANVLFFRTSPFIRPMGSIWYRSVFVFAGFNPFPFHAVNFAILLINLLLTYSVCRRLTRSREIAALATLLCSYHANFAGLYYDTGYIYDVLCYCFYFATFLYYMTIRQDKRYPATKELAVCAILYVCALNSKEMAVSLPAVLLIYELLNYASPRSWRALGPWLVREGRAVVATGIIALAFVVGRVAFEASLLGNVAYEPVFSVVRFLETSRNFLDALFYRDGWFTTNAVVVLWVCLMMVAWRTKGPALKFAWLFIMLSVLPVAFILPRGASQYYIPWFGWGMYSATALMKGSDWLSRRFSWGGEFWPSRGRAVAVFLGVALLLGPKHRDITRDTTRSVAAEGATRRSVSEEIHQLRPRFDQGAHVLFLNDPIEPDFQNDLIYIARLSYRDDTLRVDRLKAMDHKPSEVELACYDAVFDYRDGRFGEKDRPPCPSGIPRIVSGRDGPEISHADFGPVSAARPAKRGERLIAKVAGLGPTLPAVPVGEPFGQNPLARVLATATATVNGKVTAVGDKVGWPKFAGIYRVDFWVPERTQAGVAEVQFRVGGNTGPAAKIFVE